ncbi:hypothetical protein HY439_00580 [Candidatus Microgenomates bacterium]|nr:hypothetical protein [Candidatus Microgenomates bacterium]
MLKLHFLAILWRFKKVFIRKEWGRILVALAYLIVFGLLFLFIFFLGQATFKYLYSFNDVSGPVTRYILLTSLAFATLLSILTYLLSLPARLFSKNLSLYFIAPVNHLKNFQAVYLENLIFGGWPFIVLALPLLLAYLITMRGNPASYIVLILALLIIINLTESVAAILVLALKTIFKGASNKVTYLLFVLTFLGLCGLVKIIFFPAGLVEVAQRPTLNEVFAGLTNLPLSYPHLPTTLFIDSLSGKFASFLFLLIQAIIFFCLALLLAKKTYKTTWQKSQEKIFLAAPKTNLSVSTKAVKFHGTFASLLKRELVTIDRTPSQILYFAFIVFLSVIFFFLLSKKPEQSPDFPFSLVRKTAALGVIIVGYILIMLTLRFNFPSLIGDFKNFWTLRGLPGWREKVILSKWLTYTFFSLVVSWLLGIMAFFSLRLPFDFLYPLLIICLINGILISALALFIGGYFASSLPRGGIEEATTSLGGIAATLLSTIISGVLGLFFYVIFSEKNLSLGFPEIYNLHLIAIGIFALILWLIALQITKVKFSKMDII